MRGLGISSPDQDWTYAWVGVPGLTLESTTEVGICKEELLDEPDSES